MIGNSRNTLHQIFSALYKQIIVIRKSTARLFTFMEHSRVSSTTSHVLSPIVKSQASTMNFSVVLMSPCGSQLTLTLSLWGSVQWTFSGGSDGGSGGGEGLIWK